MPAGELPLDAVHWLLALVPILVLLSLLIVFRWDPQEAGPIAMFVAALIAVFIYQAPPELLAVAAGKGIWDAIFVLYVVWTALLLYHVIDQAGGFAALHQGIQHYTENELFIVLAFGWVFASFLQGIAGFGTPIAVVAPLLLALGVRPIHAVSIPLIGHAWANLYGTIGVGWLATEQVITIQEPLEAAFQTGLLLWIPNVLGAVAIAWLYGRTPAVRHAWPMIVIISILHGGVQLGVTLVDPVISAFLAGTVGLLALIPLAKLDRYAEPAEGIDNRPAMSEGEADETDGEEVEEPEEEGEPPMGLGMSLLPYVVLTIVAAGALLIPPLEAALEQIEIGPPFPEVTTGYGIEAEAEEAYQPFAPLTHPGTFLLVSTIIGWAVYRARGYYDEWGQEEGREGIWSGLADDAVPASVAIVAFLVMGLFMEDSGQTLVLAIGTGEVTPPTVYAFASGWIGMLGAFMTSSNTSSNIIFAPLQDATAETMDELVQATIIAGQHAGGAVGNVIAPANVVLGTSSIGAIGREGEILKLTIVWAVLVMAVVGVATIVLNGLTLVGGG